MSERAPMVALPIYDGLPERLTMLARVAGELADQRLDQGRWPGPGQREFHGLVARREDDALR